MIIIFVDRLMDRWVHNARQESSVSDENDHCQFEEYDCFDGNKANPMKL